MLVILHELSNAFHFSTSYLCKINNYFSIDSCPSSKYTYPADFVHWTSMKNASILQGYEADVEQRIFLHKLAAFFKRCLQK